MRRTRKATLQGLAEAITGDAADWKFLDFKGVPSPLKVGDKVDITPLLEKAAGEPKKSSDLRPRTSLRLSAKGLQFIKDYETLVLYPYDDGDPKPVKTRLTAHKRGATIGYGPYIDENEWGRFKNGITEDEAERLLASDVKKEGGNTSAI